MRDAKQSLFGGDQEAQKVQRGVAVLLHKKVKRGFQSFHRVSERWCRVDLNSGRHPHMPHMDYPNNEVESLYKAMSALKEEAQESGRLVMIAGDFNAVVGRCKPADSTRRVGAHGLGQRNSRGQMLVNWC